MKTVSIATEPKAAELEMSVEPTVAPNIATPSLHEKKDPFTTDLKTARQLAREIGKRFFDSEEYDIPTFLRRQQE